MLRKQDNKLCKLDFKSFEKHITLPEQVREIKLACPFTGSVVFPSFKQKIEKKDKNK